jgi:beta-N-acetylhexosaminidase
MADGLLVSHIRFQGFQGNIRATTRPVSFDPTALGEILDLQELAAWRQNGGLIISDNLGNRAVSFFYAPTNEGFSGDIVARDAFLAGNDLLYLGNIVSSDLDDTYATNIRILNFFIQRYKEDPAFAQQVDEAVLRILTGNINCSCASRFLTCLCRLPPLRISGSPSNWSMMWPGVPLPSSARMHRN